MSDIYYTDVIKSRLGDTYKGMWTYKILLKLGYGRFFTVWLARVLNVDPT
jgi:hypothetical protein